MIQQQTGHHSGVFSQRLFRRPWHVESHLRAIFLDGLPRRIVSVCLRAHANLQVNMQIWVFHREAICLGGLPIEIRTHRTAHLSRWRIYHTYGNVD